MADLTPEENERLTADLPAGAAVDEGAHFIETGQLFPVAAAEVEEVLLDTDQRRRVEALLEARDLLTAEVPMNSGGFAAALVGAISREQLLTKPDNFASDLMTLADYILDPAPSHPQPTIVWTGEHSPASVRMLGTVFGGIIAVPGAPPRDEGEQGDAAKPAGEEG